MWLFKRFRYVSALSLFHAFRVRDECGTPDSMTCGDIWMAGDHLLSKSLIGYRHRITHRIPHWIPHATSIQFLLDACLHIDIRYRPVRHSSHIISTPRFRPSLSLPLKHLISLTITPGRRQRPIACYRFRNIAV